MQPNPLFRTMLLAGLIGTAGASAALAQGWEGHHGHGAPFAVLRSLDLTDAQKSQVHAAIKAGWQQSRSYRAQLHAIDAQITSKLTSTGSVSLADVAPLLQQKEQIRAQLDQQQLATQLAIRNVLTPAQISKAASVEAQLASLHEQERAVTAPSASSE